MDQDALNMEIRRFLKQVGVTSQREIERAIGESDAAGKITPGVSIAVTATITAPEIGLEHRVEGQLKISG